MSEEELNEEEQEELNSHPIIIETEEKEIPEEKPPNDKIIDSYLIDDDKLESE